MTPRYTKKHETSAKNQKQALRPSRVIVLPARPPPL
jgi:hypothetical protein